MNAAATSASPMPASGTQAQRLLEAQGVVVGDADAALGARGKRPTRRVDVTKGATNPDIAGPAQS